MRKLGLLKRSELVRYAVSAGWLARDLAMGEAVDAPRERHV
jgi:hypothetical protein